MEYNTLYYFMTNTSFTLVEDESGRYFIKREYVTAGEDPVYFDIKRDYQGNGFRYITKDTRQKLENELQSQAPHLYKKIYGNEEGEMDMSQFQTILEDLNKQNMEMFKEIAGKNPYEEAIVEAIIAKGEDITEEQLLDGVRSKIDEYIKEEYGTLPSKIEVLTDRSRVELEGIFHEKFEQILNLVELDIPTLLVGPAGSGKNHTLEQVAESLELDFYFSNAITQEHKLTGFIDANGRFHETQFYEAFTNGGLFFLDEMDASIPEVLIILNAAIANKYFDFPNGRVEAHEEFRVVAAGNTVGTGADNLYVGRSQLDAATLDRFVVIEFGYDPEVESQLVSSNELYEYIVETRKVIEQNNIRHVVSMRASINASKLEGVFETHEILESVIFKGLPENEIQMIYENMSDIQGNVYFEEMRNQYGSRW